MDRKALKNAARQSVAQARGNPKRITLIFVLAQVVLVALEWGLIELIDRSASHTQYLSQALSAETRRYVLMMVVSLVCQMVMILTAMGYAGFALDISRGDEVSPRTLLDGFRFWSRTILLYLMTSILLGVWATLFSMPASYLLSALYLYGMLDENLLMSLMTLVAIVVMFLVSYRYRMAWFLFLDNPRQPVRLILTRAKLLTKTHRLELFALDLSFVPWLLLCVLTCGVLLIWKLPYIAATYAHAYSALQADWEKRQQKLEEFREQQRRWLEQNRL